MSRVLLVITIILLVFLSFRRFSNQEQPKAPAVPSSSDLKTNSQAGVLYQLPVDQQDRLVKAVEHFCVTRYHRDSCLHHLITCGVPCLERIPKAKRKAIHADYVKLRAERGLAPMPQVPQDD